MENYRQRNLLIAGDTLAILIVSVVGFLSHEESPFSPRLLTTFLPVLAAWALQSPWFGLYRAEVFREPRQSWKAALAMLLAAPLAAFLRGLMLNQSIVLVFVAALGGSAALGMGLWRLAAALWFKRAGKNG